MEANREAKSGKQPGKQIRVRKKTAQAVGPVPLKNNAV